MTQHTPGPWRVEDGSTVYGSRAGKTDKFEVCDCKGYAGEREANARLIAAAPDLLEAVRLTVELLDSDGRNSNSTVVKTCRAAIARATTSTTTEET